ncbi:MAG: methionyl-tRNA formyltransferase [Puniceicoccales bacterium]|nr:methionyl-tRNA formyltransferase [Puniceicoccales bacterium]
MPKPESIPSVIFAASHSIALPLLDLLHQEDVLAQHLRLRGIISQPDRPSGRGKSSKPTLVAQWALERKIPLHRPEKLDEGTLKWLKQQSCELLLVMAYGQMIGKSIRECPRLGIFNFHASLLPRFRGATPTEAALASEAAETGVSLMEITAAMDAGDCLGSLSVPIDFFDTQTELTAKLSHAARSLAEQFLPQLLSGTAEYHPQDSSKVSYCRKLETRDRFLDFHAPAEVLHRRIRALSPRPGCIFELGDRIYKICSTDVGPSSFCDKEAGTLLSIPPRQAAIVAGDGKYLFLREIQIPGGKCMPVTSFLLGHSFPWGSVLPSHPMRALEHPSFPF